MSEVQLILKSHPRDRQGLLSALNAFAAEQHLPASAVNAADLALEEHLTNVINYAYDGAGERTIQVRLAVVAQDFVIEVVDDGRPFNPLDRPPVDTSRPLDQKPVGGLGIHLIRQFMDEVNYSRDNGKNVLKLKKHLGLLPPSNASL